MKQITLEEAEKLALETDYAVFAVGEEINTADAGAFFLEGFNYAIKGSNMSTAGLSPLKGYYIVGNIKGGSQTETISYQRKDAIKRFLGDSTMTWKECEKVGWRCFKVDIVFQAAIKLRQ